MYTNFLKGNFEAGFKLDFNKDYEIVHFTEQRFTGFNVEEFENLFIGKNVDHITTAATDGMLEIAQERSDFKLTDHDSKLFTKYHLANCQRRELLASSSHLLYICSKVL